MAITVSSSSSWMVSVTSSLCMSASDRTLAILQQSRNRPHESPSGSLLMCLCSAIRSWSKPSF